MDKPAHPPEGKPGTPASSASIDADSKAGVSVRTADTAASERPESESVDEAARVLKGGPGEPHAGARPGQPDQASRQGFGRQRNEPQDRPPADVLDDANIAGDKDFELTPPPK